MVGHMSMMVAYQSLEWVRHFVKKGTQLEINLSGVGEPLLHPEIVEITRMTRAAAPSSPVYIVTNGLHVTAENVTALFDAGLTRITVTDHVAEATMKALRLFRRLGVRHEYSRHAVTSPNNWGGIIEWTDQVEYEFNCDWLDKGQVAVLSDGSIVRCCTDAFALGVLGNVYDNVPEMSTFPFKTCATCHHRVPLRMRHLIPKRREKSDGRDRAEFGGHSGRGSDHDYGRRVSEDEGVR